MFFSLRENQYTRREHLDKSLEQMFKKDFPPTHFRRILPTSSSGEDWRTHDSVCAVSNCFTQLDARLSCACKWGAESESEFNLKNQSHIRFLLSSCDDAAAVSCVLGEILIQQSSDFQIEFRVLDLDLAMCWDSCCGAEGDRIWIRDFEGFQDWLVGMVKIRLRFSRLWEILPLIRMDWGLQVFYIEFDSGTRTDSTSCECQQQFT